jgi:hypothetical protein
VLAGPARQTDIARTRWKPDILVTVPGVGHVHLWFLADQIVEFGEPGTTTWVPYEDRLKVLGFKQKHPGVRAAFRPTFVPNGVLRFGQGQLAAVPSSVHLIEWVRNDQVTPPEPIADRLEWTADTAHVRSMEKGAIVFADGLSNIRLGVANTRPGDAGLTHFHMYYSLLADVDGPFEIRYAKNQSGLGPLDPIDGNCVPPGCIPAP